jgi:membrane fusion protein, multidrug efflux system
VTETNQIKADEAGATPSVAEGATHGGRKANSGRKKILLWGTAGMVILVGLVFAVSEYIYTRSHESTDDAFIDGNIVPLSPRVNGHVAMVYITDNQRVKAGDLLVALDPRDFQTRLDAAAAAWQAATAADQAQNAAVELTQITAMADLDQAREGVTAAEAAVQEAEAQLTLARAALDQTSAEADAARVRHQRDTADLARYRQVAQTQAVSAQELDHVRAAEQIAAADLTAARKKVTTQQAKVLETEAVLAASRAQLQQARARLAAAQSAPQRIQQSRSQANVSRADIDKAGAEMAQARLALSYTKIYAPTDGFVTKKSVEPGQFVQAGQSILAIVPHAVWVTANFKETQLTRMQPGQPVEITVDAYPDLVFNGQVDSIQHGTGARFSLLPPENATGNYVKVVQRVPVKIVFNQTPETAQALLAPGMSVVPEVNVSAAGRKDEAHGDALNDRQSSPMKSGATPAS